MVLNFEGQGLPPGWGSFGEQGLSGHDQEGWNEEALCLKVV